MIGEIDFYFVPPEGYKETRTVGKIFWAPIPFLFERKIRFLKLDFYDEKKPSNSSFVVDSIETENIGRIPPIPPLNVKQGEFIPILNWKLRPVIEVTEAIPNWKDFENKNGNCIVVAPLYSVNDEYGNCKFRQRFVQSVQAYQYPTMFYLPSDESLGIKESLVRFDRLIVLKSETLLPWSFMLSDDCTFCLTNWLKYFFGCNLDPIIDEYRKAAISKVVGNS